MRDLTGSISPQYEERLRNLDYQAMVAYVENFQFRRLNLEKDTSQMQIPCLFYAGEADEGAHQYGKEAAKKFQKARFFSLLGLNYVGASDATGHIVPQVISFLAEMEEGKPCI